MENVNREELIKGEDMEKALLEAAEVKKTILTTYKEQDKSNYEQFYETCLNANSDIREIMGKRKKDRADEETQKLKEFQKNAKRSYKMVCDLLTPEEVEEGKPTKFQKIAEKVYLVLDYLRYIGANDLENELNKHGITLATGSRLEDKSDVWADEHVKENIKNIFIAGKKVRENVAADTQVITEEILLRAVPQELVYEKDSNPAGLKKGDWAKLVDFKTKLIMAKEDEQKEKVEDQANELAAEKQFDQERARLMQAKLVAMDMEK